ncbi:MAG: hypothetical protein AAF985_10980, partial [Bacteroidota bacterium]
ISKTEDPKLKINVSSNNELAFCLGAGKIHTYKEWKGKLIKMRTLDTDEDLIAFSSGGVNRYCAITSKTTEEHTQANTTNMHLFRGPTGNVQTKSLKIWDEYQQDILKERPFPTLDYANGEYLFQYYLLMWEAKYNRHLHSGSFRIKMKSDGSSIEPRTWQTGHTFGMDALHNGTDWVSLYVTDADYRLRHPGVFIDKVDKNEKALLFSSPQRWSEPGQGDASNGAMSYFYTGLGGIAYDGDAYGAVFINPKMTVAPKRMPQNVGFVYVKEAFEPISRRKAGETGMIDPTANILSAGTVDNVTIYTEKMNTEPRSYKRKVTWLTNYTSMESGYARNADIVAIGDQFIVLWEKWAKEREVTNRRGEKEPVWGFQGTEAVVIDKNGKVLNRKTIKGQMLNDWDDLHVQSNKIVWATYDDATFYVNRLDANLNHDVKVYNQP